MPLFWARYCAAPAQGSLRLGFKNPFHPFAIEVGKRTFIQKCRVHHASSREVVDYKVEEFDLIRVKSAAAQEFSESMFSGLPVEPHQRANETRKPAFGL